MALPRACIIGCCCWRGKAASLLLSARVAIPVENFHQELYAHITQMNINIFTARGNKQFFSLEEADSTNDTSGSQTYLKEVTSHPTPPVSPVSQSEEFHCDFQVKLGGVFIPFQIQVLFLHKICL